MHFKVHSKYFYSKLDNSGKKVYEKILDGWLNYKESITISGFNGKVDYKDIFRYVYDDNPELFYIDFNRVSVMFAPFSSIVSMKMLYPKSRCEQIKQDIADVVLKVERLCKPGVDKERVVHDYLVQNVSYSTDLYATDAHNIKRALIDGSAVCEGYARAFTILTNEEIDVKAISNSLGHSKTIITVDVYTDKKQMIVDVSEQTQEFACEILPITYLQEQQVEEANRTRFLDEIYYFPEGLAEEIMGVKL